MTSLQIKEEARLYAESQMLENWNRKDYYEVVTFYNHMVDFLCGKLTEAETTSLVAI